VPNLQDPTTARADRPERLRRGRSVAAGTLPAATNRRKHRVNREPKARESKDPQTEIRIRGD